MLNQFFDHEQLPGDGFYDEQDAGSEPHTSGGLRPLGAGGASVESGASQFQAANVDSSLSAGSGSSMAGGGFAPASFGSAGSGPTNSWVSDVGYVLLSHNSSHVSAPYSGNRDIDAVLFGSRWYPHTGSNIHYSFPTNANQYQAAYGSQSSLGGSFTTNPAGFVVFNAQQQTAARYALSLISAFTGLNFIQLTETTTTHATLRFAQTDDATLGSAHAWFPSGMYQSGDVWLGTGALNGNPQPYYTTPTPGNWGQATIMHELGHAMGLKHGHSDDRYYDTRNYLWPGDSTPNYGSDTLPSAHDGQSWTLMTYRSDPGNTLAFEGDGFNQPQTYMQNDIAAFQYLYGANYAYNSSNTTYSFSTTTGRMYINGVGQTAPSGNVIYRTIWDGGGTDIYVLSNYSTNLVIDLRPGNFSHFGMQIANNRAYTGGVNYAPGNIANALLYQNNPASLIENAIGGSGDDTFYGNTAANVFTGNAGDDTFYGLGGNDTVVFNVAVNSVNFFEHNNWEYTAASTDGNDTIHSIHRFQFGDGTFTDDFMGGISTGKYLATGSAATGNLQFRGDRDWFRTTLSASHYYVIEQHGAPSQLGTLTDTYVRLYNGVGTEVAHDDDGGPGFESALTVHVGASGTRYVGAGGWADVRTGTYTVNIVDLGTRNTRFHAPMSIATHSFGSDPSAGGWSSNNIYLRTLGDVNGDGLADIVGFGISRVYVALGQNAHFQSAVGSIASFTPGSGGWANQDGFTRVVGDVNNDGRADIVGFGNSNVFISLADGSSGGTGFAIPYADLASFGPHAGGWMSNNATPRTLADVNGDNRLDIIGFGSGGVYVSLGKTVGTPGFNIPFFALASFGTSAGGWTSYNQFPRQVADVNGDGRADIVGFGGNATFVALGQADGTFANPFVALNSFGYNPAGGGWSTFDKYPRLVQDINNDGRADIVGFGANNIYVAFGQADGRFGAPGADLSSFGYNAGGWTSDNTLPRLLGDVTGDQHAEVIGFGTGGVYVGRGLDLEHVQVV